MAIDELIRNGMIALAKNDLSSARELFKQVLQLDKTNENAWVLISKTLDKKHERVYCLKQALAINPDNQAAKLELQLLSLNPVSPPTSPPTLKTSLPESNPSTLNQTQSQIANVVTPMPPIQTADAATSTSLTQTPNLNYGLNPPQVVTHQPVNFSEAEQMAEKHAKQIVHKENDIPPMENICPICRRNDAIRRVISIVQEGTHHTTGSQTTTSETDLHGKRHYWGQNEYHLPTYQGSSNISGKATTYHTTDINLTRQTELAELLASPPVPEEPKLRDSSCVDLLMMLGIPAIAILVAIIALLTNQRGDIFGRSHLDFNNLLWFPAILVIGELLLQVAWRGPAIRSAKRQLAVEMQLYEKNDLAPWRKKMVAWEKLFYCTRDHVVYDPGSADYCDPSRLSNLLDRLIHH